MDLNRTGRNVMVERDQTKHERDLLATALGDLLVALGGATAGVPLTLPQLLLLADDAIRHLGGDPDA